MEQNVEEAEKRQLFFLSAVILCLIHFFMPNDQM